MLGERMLGMGASRLESSSGGGFLQLLACDLGKRLGLELMGEVLSS